MRGQTISTNSKCKNSLNNNQAEENATEPLKGHENKVQLTSVSVSTNSEKPAGAIQLSKYVANIQDVPKVYKNCIQTLR